MLPNKCVNIVRSALDSQTASQFARVLRTAFGGMGRVHFIR